MGRLTIPVTLLLRTFLPALVAVLSADRAAATPVFMGLGDLPGGGANCLGRALSADGSTVVGQCELAGGGGAIEAFRWTLITGMVGLGDLPGRNVPGSNARAVSADGSVVVGSTEIGGVGPARAFRWTSDGGMVDLGDLGGSGHTIAYGVSADGSVVAGGSSSVLGGQAFRWTPGEGMVGIGDLPGGLFGSSAFGISAGGSTIVGQGRGASIMLEAFHWTSVTGMVGLGDLGRGRSISMAASANGSAVVGFTGIGADTEAFLWTSTAGMIGLGDLEGGAFDSVARAVSGDGSVVVGESDGNFGTEAFMWDATNGMRALDEVLTNDYGLNLAGWTLEHAEGISADGLTIAGYGISPTGAQEAWIAMLPEPSTGLLFGAGLVGLSVRHARRWVNRPGIAGGSIR